MGKIKVESCEIEGLKVITPTVFGDERGYFMETYNYNDFKEAGIDVQFVQDNQSASKKGVLRGLHFQINYPQDKLVRVVNGEVFDVAVDLREGSKTYGKWFGAGRCGSRRGMQAAKAPVSGGCGADGRAYTALPADMGLHDARTAGAQGAARTARNGCAVGEGGRDLSTFAAGWNRFGI